jgi:O-methyltransferase
MHYLIHCVTERSPQRHGYERGARRYVRLDRIQNEETIEEMTLTETSVDTHLDHLIQSLTRLHGLTGEPRELRRLGLDWPTDGAETMIGIERMDNVKTLALDVIARGIPGDFMECGTWRGGVGILLAHILMMDSRMRRELFIADSFQGCPEPSPEFPADSGDPHHTFQFLSVPLADVKANFLKYGIDPDWQPGFVQPKSQHVSFLPGWFKDTLPGPVKKLSLLRIDADMYESTSQALEALYDLVSIGGHVILDDFQNIPNCQMAIRDFRKRRGITEPIHKVDWCAVYWTKERA